MTDPGATAPRIKVDGLLADAFCTARCHMCQYPMTPRWCPCAGQGSFLADSYAGLQDPGISRALRQLASAAVRDEHVAEVLTEFTAQRRAALRALLERGVASGGIPASADLDMLADLAYGVLWYRLLIAHAPLDADAARGLAAHLIAAGQAGSEPA